MDDNTRVFLKYVDVIQNISKIKGYKNAKDWITKGKDCKLDINAKYRLQTLVDRRNTIAHQGVNLKVAKEDIDFLYKTIESTGLDMKLLTVDTVDNSKKDIEKKPKNSIFYLQTSYEVLEIDFSRFAKAVIVDNRLIVYGGVIKEGNCSSIYEARQCLKAVCDAATKYRLDNKFNQLFYLLTSYGVFEIDFSKFAKAVIDDDYNLIVYDYGGGIKKANCSSINEARQCLKAVCDAATKYRQNNH